MKLCITVKALPCRETKISIDENNTIGQLKASIENVFGFVPNEQRLLFNNIILDKDDDKIISCRIENGSVINVSTILSKFNVTIQTTNGQKFAIEVKPNETVANLKSKIKDASSIPMDEQTLLYNGNVLVNTCSLSSSGIIDYCIICLILKLKDTYGLLIEMPSGTRDTFEINGTETIRGLKLKIQKKLKISLDDHELFYQESLLNDDDIVNKCGVYNHSQIPIIVRQKYLRIFIKMFNVTLFEFKIIKNETIRNVKLEIQERMGCHPDDQRLVFRGIFLEDETKVDQYGIDNNSVIHVIYRPKKLMNILVKLYNGRLIRFEIGKDETVRALKRKIQEKCGMDITYLHLRFNTMDLDDSKSMDEYEISDLSTIDSSILYLHY